MTVGSCLRIDRTQQVEITNDRRRTQIEHLENGGLDVRVSLNARAEGLNEDTHRMRLTNGVSDLNFTATSQACSNNILGYPTHRVGRRAVNLGRILTREGATAMTCHAAVGVDDDLAAGQTGVTHRAANFKAPRWVYQETEPLGLDA